MTIDDLIEEGKDLQKGVEGFITDEDDPQFIGPFRDLNTDGDYIAWTERTKRFIQINYPGDRALDLFESASELLEKNFAIKKQIAILISLKELPQKCARKEKGPKISVVQTQSQSQTFNIVIDILKDHLTVRQYDEIKNIIKEISDKEDAKSKIKEKLKEFGESVLSNIISSLIINPSVWEYL